MGEADGICGRCLCGAVEYEVRGELDDVLICHCIECRRWHGHVSATAACRRDELVIADDSSLAWIQSPASDAQARRGFCRECGSSLFWDSPLYDTVSIAAGTLDQPTGLAVASHWYVDDAADYYALPADGTVQHKRGGTEL
jgi:hypothetical protein